MHFVYRALFTERKMPITDKSIRITRHKRKQNLRERMSASRELKALAHLQLGDHAGLGVVGHGEVVHEALGEVLAVVLLEHVLVVEVLEDSHLQEQWEGERVAFPRNRRLSSVRKVEDSRLTRHSTIDRRHSTMYTIFINL